MGLASTRLQPDLNSLNGFLPKWNYPNVRDSVEHSEWGAVNNVRFFVSSQGSITPNASLLGNDVFNNMILGLEALACVEQDNFSSRFLYRPPVYSDPLFQNVTLGYVFAEVPRILADYWLSNTRSTLR